MCSLCVCVLPAAVPLPQQHREQHSLQHSWSLSRTLMLLLPREPAYGAKTAQKSTLPGVSSDFLVRLWGNPPWWSTCWKNHHHAQLLYDINRVAYWDISPIAVTPTSSQQPDNEDARKQCPQNVPRQREEQSPLHIEQRVLHNHAAMVKHLKAPAHLSLDVSQTVSLWQLWSTAPIRAIVNHFNIQI